MHADSPELPANGQSHFIDQVVVVNRTKCHLVRKAHCTVQSHPQAPFPIHGHPEWNIGNRLIKIC